MGIRAKVYSSEEEERAALGEFFWPQVNKNGPVVRPELGPCWEWAGNARPTGYGRVNWRRRGLGTHRVAWELANGRRVPGGLCVCHKCDNTLCVRPDHLWVGTTADNLGDMARKGRAATGDRNGSRLRPERLKRGNEHPAHLHPELAARGASNGNSRLTEEIVAQIREIYRRGDASKAALARQFGVDPKTIVHIVTRRTWGHVA